MAKHKVATEQELREAGMKRVKAGGVTLLLVSAGEEIHAVADECPHAGASLSKGTLCGCRVRCPWHQSVFGADGGDLEEPVALDGLQSFQVSLQEGDVYVEVPEKAALSRVMPMVGHEPEEDDRLFALVGAGAAGGAAAEALRQQGFRGRIVLITREPHPPYDRTALSKTYLKIPGSDSAPPLLRDPGFYEAHDIELMIGRQVTALDAGSRTIRFADGGELAYERALVATGGRPRRLKVEGAELDGVFTLRSLEDADRIRAAIEDAQRAVVVGASFIGMETAASLAGRELAVTVVAPESRPFELVLGSEVGEVFQKLHESKGVRFELGRTVERFEGEETIGAVVLDGGHRIEADMVLVGIGVEPATGFLEGVKLAEDGGVVVDEGLRAADGLFAGGDIARFPDPRTGEPIRIEHWRLALQHGRLAARGMCGEEARLEDVPFFWTTQFRNSARYVGHAPGWEETIIDGEPAERKFIVFYAAGGRVWGAFGWGRDREMDAVAELMRAGRMPTPEELRSGEVELLERLGSVC